MSNSDPTNVASHGGQTWLGDVSIDEIGAAQQSVSEDDATAAGANPPGPILPIPGGPIPLVKRAVSGRYRGASGSFQIELRVDVDRTRPMNRVSADFFQVSGGTTTYTGSFVVNSPVITVSATQVVIKGLGSFTFTAGAPVVQVTIPRRTILQPQAPAALQFFTTGNAPGALYSCAFESVHFRTVRLETDRVSNLTTPVFSSYDTGALPSGGPGRNLTVVSAFAEAGIEMVATAQSNVVPIAEAQAGATWSNAELHASMERHFSLYQDNQQWAVWQLAAQRHDIGANLYGIMFDQQGKQRQGCAVFHEGIGGVTAARQRLQLYTYVHELGHNFNLLHSWQKSLGTPPTPNRPLSLSWMNYPFNYPAPGGEATYWNQFAFQFDNEEVIHLRHAFRNNIIMGGSDFAVGSAFENDLMPDTVRDESGLSLNISTHQRKFKLGEPVVLELALHTTDVRGRRVHTWLHPNFSLLQVAIRKPSGEVVPYEPFIHHLVGEQCQTIKHDRPVRDSAYIGFGKDGLYFQQPGDYQIRASYAALDGSNVLSNILTVRVAYPVGKDDEAVADLLMGEEQGTLFYLLGSDNESLRNGNAAFDEVLARYSKHSLADYVRLVKGVNAGRSFKTITEGDDRTVTVREADPQESAQLLTAVANSKVLDSKSEEMALSKLAEAQKLQGDEASAAATISRILDGTALETTAGKRAK
jgi:hypothetical protein